MRGRRSRSGDVVDIKNDKWHWHLAAQDHFITRLSLTEGDTESGAHVHLQLR